MNLLLRQEKPADFRATEELTREAFWNLNTPACVEHYLTHILRDSKSFVPELDLLALKGDQLVGNIIYTKAIIKKDDGSTQEVLSFGPLAVLPAYQHQGIGTALIERTKELATQMGYTAILIFGNSEYYQRFGFKAAENYRIGTEWNTYADALLALELVPNALANAAGVFIEDPAFNVDEAQVSAFDKTFVPKEKLEGLPSQLKFMEQVQKNKPRT